VKNVAIVLVDDEPLILKVLVRILKVMPKMQIQPHPFPNAMEACVYIASCPVPPDLIISDYNMPEMTGLALFEVTRKQSIPFILTSGDPSPRVLDLISRKGGRFCPKPDFKGLGEAVRDLVHLTSED